MSKINEKNLKAALRGSGDLCFEMARLYKAADESESALQQQMQICSYDARFNLNVYEYDATAWRLATAKQILGVICKLQRLTGLKILTQHIGSDEEKVELLQELCDIFNRTIASTVNDSYTK